jgi:predicted nuclease of predicted toxin-antitoxin system
VKFKFDENLPAECSVCLRNFGHDSETVAAEKPTGAQDSELFERCQREERILVTLDLDFANVQLYPPESNAGVIVLSPPVQDKQTLIALTLRLVQVLNTKSASQQLWIVEADRIRVREG